MTTAGKGIRERRLERSLRPLWALCRMQESAPVWRWTGQPYFWHSECQQAALWSRSQPKVLWLQSLPCRRWDVTWQARCAFQAPKNP